MHPLKKLLPYLKPYWKLAVFCLVLLTSVVFMDLAVPRLIQRIIDQGIIQKNQSVVLQTFAIMKCATRLSALISLHNSAGHAACGVTC
jgi:ATP-binding cassette subfamily B protein